MFMIRMLSKRELWKYKFRMSLFHYIYKFTKKTYILYFIVFFGKKTFDKKLPVCLYFALYLELWEESSTGSWATYQAK